LGAAPFALRRILGQRRRPGTVCWTTATARSGRS